MRHDDKDRTIPIVDPDNPHPMSAYHRIIGHVAMTHLVIVTVKGNHQMSSYSILLNLYMTHWSFRVLSLISDCHALPLTSR